MPFDGIVAKAVTCELQTKLLGGRIGKIHQPERDTLVLQIRAGGANHKLLLSTNPAAARIHLTDQSYENPDKAPMFCMLLRKHLTGGLIRSISSPGFERIVMIEIEAEDELGDRSIKKLVIEIMGRHSNLMLLNRNDIIHDAIRHIDASLSRVREVLPAHPYVLPPAQDKWFANDPSTPLLLTAMLPESGRKISGLLLDKLMGFSPILAREICFRAGIDDDKAANTLTNDEIDKLTKTLKWFQEELSAILIEGNTPSGFLAAEADSGKIVDYHIIPLTSLVATNQSLSICDAMNKFFGDRNIVSRHVQKQSTLLKIISQKLDKVEHMIGVQQQTLDENQRFEDWRIYGELLTAFMHTLSIGMTEALLPNYYSENAEPIAIPLDPTLTPQKNAQFWFRKYQKAKTAQAYANTRLIGLKEEGAWLESVRYAIEDADSDTLIAEIRAELIDQGYLKPVADKRKRGEKRLPERAAEPLQVTSCDGFDILIGRNNRQNDRLTLKLARQNDLWFHIKHYSGSHVVIRTDGKAVPSTTIEEAAGYAAWYSKARQAGKTEVDYTEIRHVKKPSGGKPGMVIYVQYETVVIAPKSISHKPV